MSHDEENGYRVEVDTKSPIANGDKVNSVYNAVFGAKVVDSRTGREKRYPGFDERIRTVIYLVFACFILNAIEVAHDLGLPLSGIGTLIKTFFELK